MTDAGERHLDRATWGSLGLLATSNVVANSLLPTGWYVPWNLAMTGTTVTLATGPGARTPADLGLAAEDAVRGLQVGAAASLAISSAVALATRWPTTRRAFVDERGQVNGRELAVRVLFRVPWGTALFEEVAFRGALPALLEARPGWTHRRAVVVSSLLFGAWHVLPSLRSGETNEALGRNDPGPAGRLPAVALSVVTTAVAGVVFAWLRDRSRSLVAPILCHAAVNGAGHVAAWWVTPDRVGPPGPAPADAPGAAS